MALLDYLLKGNVATGLARRHYHWASSLNSFAFAVTPFYTLWTILISPVI